MKRKEKTLRRTGGGAARQAARQITAAQAAGIDIRTLKVRRNKAQQDVTGRNKVQLGATALETAAGIDIRTLKVHCRCKKVQWA